MLAYIPYMDPMGIKDPAVKVGLEPSRIKVSTLRPSGPTGAAGAAASDAQTTRVASPSTPSERTPVKPGPAPRGAVAAVKPTGGKCQECHRFPGMG